MTPRVPTNVVVVCSILVAGAEVAVVLAAVQFFLTAGILQGDGNSPGAPFAPMGVIKGLLFLAAASLWLWMGWKNYQGRLWARNLTIVLGILTLLAASIAFLTLSSRLTVVASISYGVSAILSVIVLALIGRQESNNIYQKLRRRQPTGDEELPTHSAPEYLGDFSTGEQLSKNGRTSQRQ
ncbi:hypothetical protein ACSBOX_11525 [Arthrobacter sp. KN11-1C]|uniref:hypothetical protein n=1 Tax=Arthrobacter sp. KN11-1C TaxID=3445774 RepID=UPI003FA0CD33